MIQRNNSVQDIASEEKIHVKATGLLQISLSYNLKHNFPSGGPLMSTYNRTWQIIGITSYGEGCARAHKPGELKILNWKAEGAIISLQECTHESVFIVIGSMKQSVDIQRTSMNIYSICRIIST